jgi:hypothetical protein
MKQADLLETAKELRTQVRAKAGLLPLWDDASQSMQDFYLMLARRAEGLDAPDWKVERLQ